VQKLETNFRWVILGLLFIATTILYIDRSAPGILAPHLQNEIGWNEEQYGMINSVFLNLAIGQSANFPAAIKVVAEWFPKIKTINI
jgi:sugar phosphate permease